MWRNIYNTGLSLRRLCNLHLIDPSKILSKQLSIDTTLLESALKLTLFKGDTFRASEDILQPWQSPEILYRLCMVGGMNLLSSIETSVQFRVFLELYVG